jgi:two-component sensor histidine kinase
LSPEVTPQHREQVRALLGDFRALVQRTGSTNSVADYVSHLNGRLDALARVQEILMRDPDQPVDLAELVVDEFLSQGILDSLEASTTTLLLDRNVAAALAVALHELATNAIKFGQLDGTDRKVRVHWGPSEGVEGWVVLDWREQPLVAAPAESAPGFGFHMIRNLLPQQISARTSIGLGQNGLNCRMIFLPRLGLQPGEGHLRRSQP